MENENTNTMENEKVNSLLAIISKNLGWEVDSTDGGDWFELAFECENGLREYRVCYGEDVESIVGEITKWADEFSPEKEVKSLIAEEPSSVASVEKLIADCKEFYYRLTMLRDIVKVLADNK